MSDTYTKLFSSITESTVWGESYATRIVWIAMLAMADARGNVYGSVPGLARRANVTLSEAQEALAAFYAPDPHSRTKDSDGRRVEEIDGGWRLINHAKYAAIRSAEERREYKRQWDRENRKRTESDNPTDPRQNPTNPTGATPLTPALTEDQEHSCPKPAVSDHAPAAASKAERLAAVTEDAIETFNAAPFTVAHGGRVPNVSTVNRDKRRQQVNRAIRVIREICAAEFGSQAITREFWSAYWQLVNRDPFASGRQAGSGAHSNWLPSFEYLTRPDTITAIYERAEAAA